MSEAASDGAALRAMLAVFGVEIDEASLKKGENQINAFVDKLKKVGEGVAAAFAFKELYDFTEGQARATHAIERTADMLGLSTERVQAFQFAAKSLGEDGDTLTGLMGRLQVAQAGMTSGAKGAGAAFKALGVSTKDAVGKNKSVDALFLDTAEALSKVQDPAKQAAFASQLFSRGGRQLLPILKKGKEGLGELIARYKELGGGYTKEAIERGKEFEAASAEQNQALTGLSGTMVEVLFPIMTKLVKWSTSLVKGFKELVKGTNLVEAALGVLGVAALYVAAPLVAAAGPVIAMAAALGLLILVVEDIIGLFTGKDSLIGEWIDEVFGKGQSVETVKDLRDYWHDVRDAIRDIANYFEDANKAMKDFFDTAEEVPVLGKIFKETGIGYGRKLEQGGSASFQPGAKDLAYLRSLGGPQSKMLPPSGGALQSSAPPMLSVGDVISRPRVQHFSSGPRRDDDASRPIQIQTTHNLSIDLDKAHHTMKSIAKVEAKNDRKRAHRTLPQGTP